MFQYYKDLDLSLSPHPLTGDISEKNNLDAIKRSLRHLMLLEKGDIPFESFIHGYSNDFLFSLPSGINVISLKENVRWLIETFEPRVEIKELDVNLNNNETGFNIRIEYSIKTLKLEDSLDFLIQRVR